MQPPWSVPDCELAALKNASIEVIAGLVHHGSGPAHTNLLDPDFPLKLAAYAGAVAARYPRINDWTPINEPLTTARFSGLYGFWYPHRRDDPSFVQALLHQCRAIVLSVQAICAVNPRARLVQTNDLGKTEVRPRWRKWAAFTTSDDGSPGIYRAVPSVLHTRYGAI